MSSRDFQIGAKRRKFPAHQGDDRCRPEPQPSGLPLRFNEPAASTDPSVSLNFAAIIGSWAPGTRSSAPWPCGPARISNCWTWRIGGSSLFPPALAQLLGRSKVAQAEVLGEFMVPGTFVAYGWPIWPTTSPNFRHRAAVVSQAGPGPPGSGGEPLAFPGGPLQPGRAPAPVLSPGGAALVDGARDLRVVVVADYAEAYERVNPHSFRKNLFQGGSSRPAALTPAQLLFLPPGHGPGKISLRHPGPLLVSPAGADLSF